MQVNNRLFEIVYIIMQKRKITAKELADRFEVSTIFIAYGQQEVSKEKELEKNYQNMQ